MRKTYGWLMISLCLWGCAAKHTDDPLEPMNRTIYGANKMLDKAIIKPVSRGYNQLPTAIHTGVDNFFNNLHEIPNTANHIAQGKWDAAAKSTSRFLVNTTFGGLGFLDMAAHLGLSYEREDFGQTLASWGYTRSSYLVLPVFGPSTVRDTIGMTADYTIGVWPHLDDETRYALAGIYGVSARAKLLQQEKAIKTAALDEYAMVRDAYLQRRNFLISDGALPLDEYPEDGYWEE